MFGLLNPIWLFALGALGIPVVIHLWNIRPGKTLKVGSISLISESSRKSSRSLKLTDLLLLFVRCLLLAVLAFLLASPYLQQTVSAQKTKGWLLIPQENFRESYAKFKPLIDSLDKAGYEFHYFNKGFAKADLKKIVADTSIKDSAAIKPANYWSLISRLGEKVPNNIPVYLVTPNSLSHFAGNRPSVSLNLQWKTYTPADSVSTWIERGWFTSDNDIRVTQGNSKPSATWFSSQMIKSGQVASSAFVVDVSNGRPTVSLKNSKQPLVLIYTSSMHIAIVDGKNETDASYLKAALTAVAQFGEHKTMIRDYASEARIPAKQDWIFWLSEQKASADLFQKGSNVFMYEVGKVSATDSWIKTSSGAGQQERISLYKTIGTKNSNGQPAWQDGFGEPVLSVEKSGTASVYHFYSRFNPAWNDLVWSDDFPKELLVLLNGSQPPTNSLYDRRAMDSRQLLPQIVKPTEVNAPKNITDQQDLSHYFWLLLVALFLVERWLSHKNKLISANG